MALARDKRMRSPARGATRRFQADTPDDVSALREGYARTLAPGQHMPRLLTEHDAAWPLPAVLVPDPFSTETQPPVLPEAAGEVSPERHGPIGAAIARLAERLSGGMAEDAGALLLGLQRGEIVLRYQPIVRISDGRPIMQEALARWQRVAADLPPDTFVPLAERSGLGRLLSMVVARRAAVEIAGLRPRFRQPVSINLPLAVLLEQDAVSWLAHAMQDTGLAPSELMLELTETTPVRDMPALGRALTRLRRAGHRVLLDDLSLDDGRLLLMGLPFNGVKLDRDFTASLPHSHRARAAVRNIVRIARRRGMSVTAEGVADSRLWRIAAALGVDHAQGWAIGRPLPALALAGWVAAWDATQRR